MKILVQDLETLCFLAADGGWVGDRNDARDFHSLLPAYYYARDHTTRRFQILLYCPEDNFLTGIIAGQGIANKRIQIPVSRLTERRVAIPVRNRLRRFNGVVFPGGLDGSRNHLN